MRLPTHDTVSKTVADAMHTVKDSIVHLFYLTIGKEYSENVRLAEKELNRGLECSTLARLGKRKRCTGDVLYCLTSEQLKCADKRAQSIITPSHVDFTPIDLPLLDSPVSSHMTGNRYQILRNWCFVHKSGCMNL